MIYLNIEQGSQVWFDYRVGKITGTRFGQLISSRENRLIDEIVNERLDGFIEPDDYISEEMQFGIDNESVAIDLYSKMLGIEFDRGGVMQSELNSNHMASPDAISKDRRIVVEVKSTMDGSIHLKRFRNGIESNYLPQCINYFAVGDEVEEVHFISYCPFRPERPIVAIIFKRDTVVESSKKGDVTVSDFVNIGRKLLPDFYTKVERLENQFKHIDF
jgi:hypothetical protein